MFRRAAFVLLAICSAVFSQQPARFDVASIRPHERDASGIPRGGPGTDDPEHFTWGNMSLRALVQGAYGLNGRQVVTPDWMTTTRFDLAAKLPAGATKQDLRQMERTLLEERFHLRSHYEERNYKIYNLVVAKGGLKVQPAPGGSAFQFQKEGLYTAGAKGPNGYSTWTPIAGGGYDITGSRIKMSDLVVLVENQVGVNVFDKTGIEGVYDLKMRVASNDINVGNPNALPTIFDALEKLGFRLEPGTANLPTLIVDSADRVPTEN